MAVRRWLERIVSIGGVLLALWTLATLRDHLLPREFVFSLVGAGVLAGFVLALPSRDWRWNPLLVGIVTGFGTWTVSGAIDASMGREAAPGVWLVLGLCAAGFIPGQLLGRLVHSRFFERPHDSMQSEGHPT